MLIVFACSVGSISNSKEYRQEVKDLKHEIDQCRKSGSYWLFGNYSIDYHVKDEPKFHEFLTEQAQEMLENGELELFSYYIKMLEVNNASYRNLEGINNAIQERFSAPDSLNDAFLLFRYFELREVKYYNKQLILSQNTGCLAAYIEANGTKEFTVTPGEGFYANEENYATKDIIGNPDSPLYAAVSVTHHGDFKLEVEHGVQLNSFYQEEAYSREKYYFLGERVPFGPRDGQIVWSGDYLFCFDTEGNMKDYHRFT